MTAGKVFCTLISAALAINAADDGASAGEQKTFVACPLVRDTKTVPCWLAEYNGETYYLGIQSDQAAVFQPPQLKHRVLVEGVVKPGPKICGGVVLNPIKISVMPDIDESCNVILPAVDMYTVPFAKRGPGPNSPEYRFNPPPPPAAPTPPFALKEFTIYYDFDAERAGRMARVITEAMTYAKAAHAKHVEVTGYRAAVRLSDGSELTESPGIAEHRAKVMAETLRDIGVPASIISATWKNEPDLGTGMDAPKKRRLNIVVTPE